MAAPTHDPSERPLKKVKFSPNVFIKEFDAYQAADTVVFHLVKGKTVDELELEIKSGGQPFHCEYYNQVFGESEEIRGYKGLKVDVWLSVNSFHCWVDVRWAEKQAGADDVISLLQAWWPEPFTNSKQEFLQLAAAAPAHDFSELGEPLCNIGDAAGQHVRLYHKRVTETPGWFKMLHSRLQPLLIFTIDGANFIDANDPKWEIMPAVLTQQNGEQHMIGFLMMYNFYAWRSRAAHHIPNSCAAGCSANTVLQSMHHSRPLNERPRVSQVLVLPPLQGAGYGKAMVSAAYELARKRDAVDLTFEDPAPGLQRLREKLEVEMMLQHPWVVEAAAAALAAAEAEEHRQKSAARQLWEAGGKSRQQQSAASTQQHQQQQQQTGSAAMTAPGRGQGGASLAATATANGGSSAAGAAHGGPSPASLLSMPSQLQRRTTKELKIHKHQVQAVWEALLFVQAAGCVSADHPLAEALQELVLARIEGSSSPMADRHAACKRMVAVQDKDEDWFVYKVRKHQRSAEGTGANGLGLISNTVNTGRHTLTEVSADDWGNRLQELVGQRMEQLATLKLKMTLAK